MLLFLKINDDFMMIIILILIVIIWSFRQGLGDNAGWTSTAFWWIEPWFLDYVGNAVNFLQMWWLETCKCKNMKFEWEKNRDESLVDLHGWESFDVTQELHVLLLGDRTEPTKEGLMGCACYEPLGDVQTIDRDSIPNFSFSMIPSLGCRCVGIFPASPHLDFSL